MFGNLHEECGVFGIYSPERCDVANLSYFALYALQHRGQESCGIAVNDNGIITSHKDVGLVNAVFNESTLSSLGLGKIAVGHVRYSTTGTVNVINAQPIVISHIKGTMAIAHNGNIVNSSELRKEFELDGAIFHTSNDTEVIAYAIIRQRLVTNSIENAIERAMYKLKGAYSLVITSPRKLIAVRDPIGFRPLCMGKRENQIVFASETCALDSIGAQFVRDIDPGEIVIVEDNEVRSIRTHCSNEKSHVCVFEYIYFSRPDSVVDGVSVHLARQRAGKFLAINSPVDADVVIGVPDSGLDAAIGFSKQSGIPYGVGLIKNRYVGRTFIEPTQLLREQAVRIKLNALAATVTGKRVVMIDDSIVRGTTSKNIVTLLRDAGAKEVHMRISSPPFRNPCYFGTDIDSRDKLIACRLSTQEICESIGADSLYFLRIEDSQKLVDDPEIKCCNGCFSGVYPIEVPDEMPKNRFECKIGENR